MSNLKSVFVALAMSGLMAFSISAVAQRGPGGGGGGRRFGEGAIQVLTSELGLSQSQQSKVHAIVDKYAPQMEGMRGDPNARQKVRGIVDQEQKEIRSILTSQQKSKLDSVGGFRGLMGPAGRMRHELEQLGLNASQKHKTNVILNDLTSKMSAMMDSGSRPDFQQMRTIMEGHRGQIEAVLTPSQKTKFDADLPTFGPGGRRGGGGRSGRGG